MSAATAFGIPNVGWAVNTTAKPVRPTRSAEGLEIPRPFRNRSHETGRHRVVRRCLGVPVQPDIAAQALGPSDQRLCAQAGEQAVEVVVVDLFAVEASGNRERHRQDGIAERILARTLARFLDEGDEILFQLAGIGHRIGWAAVKHAHRSTLSGQKKEDGPGVESP